jgi:cytochrome c551/c552
VKNGSRGVWGTIPMPSQSDVPNADLDTIIAWILRSK